MKDEKIMIDITAKHETSNRKELREIIEGIKHMKHLDSLSRQLRFESIDRGVSKCDIPMLELKLSKRYDIPKSSQLNYIIAMMFTLYGSDLIER